MLDPLYIGEPNIVFCEIRDLDETNVTGATVTFSVKEQDGDVIGSANVSMTYVAGRTRYEGTFSATDAALLNEGQEYQVWITASGYTLRVLNRKSQYRERN